MAAALAPLLLLFGVYLLALQIYPILQVVLDPELAKAENLVQKLPNGEVRVLLHRHFNQLFEVSLHQVYS